MFRKIRRFKQEMPAEECRELLKTQVRGVLSLLGDDGYPYGLPIDYWYNEADGKLYFHGAKEGHKIDAIRACDKASFCIHDEGVRMDGEWPLHFRSVIVFGRIAPVTDEAATALACKELSRKFTPDDEYFNKEYAAAKDRVLCLALTPEQRSFVLSFLRNRGNIREMEKELGISYPTVRARLDQILAALGLEANPGKEKPARKEVLEMLAQGEITQEQALDMLKKP